MILFAITKLANLTNFTTKLNTSEIALYEIKYLPSCLKIFLILKHFNKRIWSYSLVSQFWFPSYRH